MFRYNKTCNIILTTDVLSKLMFLTLYSYQRLFCKCTDNDPSNLLRPLQIPQRKATKKPRPEGTFNCRESCTCYNKSESTKIRKSGKKIYEKCE